MLQGKNVFGAGGGWRLVCYREYYLPAAMAVCATAKRVLTASFHSSFATRIPNHQNCLS